MKLVECVPNFSEGRRSDVIDAIRAAIAATPGAAVLDVSSDRWHNRTVITFVAPLEHAVGAAFAGVREAADRIDITSHSGVHPRIGATDVVPFVPLGEGENDGGSGAGRESATMDDCIYLARELGERVAGELSIPVYLYDRAATIPEHASLADVRRGGFEALRDAIHGDPARAPDFGPKRVHPTAGAVAIGARKMLVAFNVYLGDARNIGVARDVVRAVRASSGGMPAVKALALEVDGQAQVSMNLVDLDVTPLHAAFCRVREEAALRGACVTRSEIVGLAPEHAMLEAARSALLLDSPPEVRSLERRLSQVNPLLGDRGLTTLLGAIGAPTLAPAGGSVTAIAGALAAALAHMVAALTAGRPRYAAVEAEMHEAMDSAAALMAELTELAARDAVAYESVVRAARAPKVAEGADTRIRRDALDRALLEAARVPLDTARACTRVAELAARLADVANRNAVGDAGVAALLAEAACRGAVNNVRLNVASMGRGDAGTSPSLVREAVTLGERAATASRRASAAVNAAVVDNR
ncbi:MAG: glutamate formimidoyltransferase [Gemmatimonadaceae bacterium]